MNDYEEENLRCYFHPKEVIVGICALCLKERLLVLASNQKHRKVTKDTCKPSKFPQRYLIFALGSFRHRLNALNDKAEDSDRDTIASLEDSFISIKFEDNGQASWEKSTKSKISIEPLNFACNRNSSKREKEIKTVVEHTKPRASWRWRKKMGHLFQVIRWKKSNKTSSRPMGNKVEGLKGRRNWMLRALTKSSLD